MKLINYIKVENFRGFQDTQTLYIAENKKITFLVGQNNSGKSLIPKLFSVFKYGLSKIFTAIDFSDNEFHNIDTDKIIQIELGLNKDFFASSNNPNLSKIQTIEDVALNIEFAKKKNVFRLLSLKSNAAKSHEIIENDGSYGHKYNEDFSNDYDKSDIENVISGLYNFLYESILVFEPIRSFSIPSGNMMFTAGKELIDWLNDDNDRGQKTKARQIISDYLKEFNLDIPTAVRGIENGLQFTFPNYLELSSNEVGTGYTMLYILLMEIVRRKKSIVLIDEIESHLQPGMIRVLVELIRNVSDFQYIIATHSPTVIECAKEEDFLYRFYKENGKCEITPFFSHGDKADYKILRTVANDLGVLPGDALLSNVVIWVEGPSEIFWLRTWLKNYIKTYKQEVGLQRNIIEGLHFSILMTGGGLISHQSFDESDIDIENYTIDGKLKLLRINPHPIVIIDSDNASGKKSQRILRISNELREHNLSFNDDKFQNKEEDFEDVADIELPNMWLLKGKELENYCHPQLLKDFYTERSKQNSSKITGVSDLDDEDWNVYSEIEGAGEILENRGLTNVKIDSGALKHKDALAKYVFNNLTEEHFNKTPSSMIKPSEILIDDLLNNLKKIFDYIRLINKIT